MRSGGGASNVYAYEPNSEAYEVLLRNIKHNGFERVIYPSKFAVSDKDGAKVKIPKQSSPYNQVMKGDSNGENVETVTLETILISNAIGSLDLLKIDCEGAEYDMLFNSGDSVFSRIREIRMEFHDGPIDSLISYMKSHGYRLISMARDSAILKLKRAE